MPHHQIALELIRQVGQPLVAPSANKSGKPSSTTAEHVLSDFEEGVVLDGGRAEGGLESTVVSLVGDVPVVCRPGLISREDLSQVLGVEVEFGQGASPGTKYRHYAPKAKIRIVHSHAIEREENRFYMSTEKHSGFHHMTASTFYALLRQADQEGCCEIIVVGDPKDEALKDRLMRASGGEAGRSNDEIVFLSASS
jgi:L-threonylcarbamoyladenylate synthase